MEHAAVVVLHWLGQVIAARLAGTAADAAFKRLKPNIVGLYHSALGYKVAADEHTQAVKEQEEATKRIQTATLETPDIIEEAAQRIEQMHTLVMTLEQEKSDLLKRIAELEAQSDASPFQESKGGQA